MKKRLAGSMRSAIISRSKLSGKTKAAWLLQKDILNCALHCFGSHKKCSADFCKVVQKVWSSQRKETSLAISDEQSAITELDSSRCNELLLSNDSSTSSWTSESQSVSINSESSLLTHSTTDQMLSSSTFDDSNCYEVSVSSCSSVVTNDDINGDTVCEILRDQQTAWEDAVSEDPSDLLEPSRPIDIPSRLAAKAEQLIVRQQQHNIYLKFQTTYSFFI